MKLWAESVPRRKNVSYWGEWPFGGGAKEYVPAGLQLRYVNGKNAGHVIGAPAREVARRLKLVAGDCVKVSVKIEKA